MPATPAPLLAISALPSSPAAAKQALILMERDLVDARTYEQIRRVEVIAEALKRLYAEVEDVRQQAEQTIVLASHRVGEELRAVPDARGGDRKSDQKPPQSASDRPTLAEQVGSKNRGLRLKKLAETPRAAIVDTVKKLQQTGKDATITAVLTALHGDGKAERRRQREVDLAEATIAASKQAGTKLYGVIYADPPWRFEPWSRETGMDRAADNHYPTETVDKIAAMSVPRADDAVLFLWATVPMLLDALDVMDAWGFEYKSHFIWLKNKIGTGYWNRNKHELLLVGTRGNIPAPTPGEQYESVISADLEEHSRKPFHFREMIEEMFPTLPRIELFARQRFAGWDAWGNEVEP